jgi:hypothetical protein
MAGVPRLILARMGGHVQFGLDGLSVVLKPWPGSAGKRSARVSFHSVSG